MENLTQYYNWDQAAGRKQKNGRMKLSRIRFWLSHLQLNKVNNNQSLGICFKYVFVKETKADKNTSEALKTKFKINSLFSE